jgi:hypothetical protein
MKNGIGLLLLILTGFSLTCYGENLNYQNKGGKLHLQGADPSSVAAKANQETSLHSSPFSEALQDPIVNSMMGGYSNMIQGMTGASYNPTEQQKQAADYAKQNASTKGNDE